jgi:hypothetical protein
MSGDDRVRYCPQCDLNVYNFSGMAPEEIDQIVAARTGRLCARLYQRADTTVLTKDCPVGSRRDAVSLGSRLATAAFATLVSIAPVRANATPALSAFSQEQLRQADDALVLVVRDIVGGVIPKAAVSLVNRQTGQRFEFETDARGEFRTSKLPPGSYDLTVTAVGFTSFIEKDLSTPSRVNITLQIGMLMGDVVVVTNPASSEFSAAFSEPARLSEAASVNPIVSLKSPDHRNAFQRFFAKIHHLFQ